MFFFNSEGKFGSGDIILTDPTLLTDPPLEFDPKFLKKISIFFDCILTAFLG